MVVYQKHLIFQSNLHNPRTGNLLFDKISPFLEKFFDEVSKSIEKFMPEENVLAFQSLDPKVWNVENDNIIYLPKISGVADMFGMNAQLAEVQFTELANKIVKDNQLFWCKHRMSDPAFFWANVLSNFQLPEEISDIIKMTLAIPLSSADSERSFSILNIIRGSYVDNCRFRILNFLSIFIRYYKNNPFTRNV